MNSFCFGFSLHGIYFHTVMRSVTRRYVEKDRIIFIKRTLIEPIFKGVSYSLVETSRMVLKRGDLSVLGPTTVMQTHREAEIQGDISGDGNNDSPSLDIGVKDWENNITRHNNNLEDQLIRATKV
ncbi:unnamed protein product [Phytophthora fragariaefolia]|uniref:Unnamed protein product n=1 Tax=Phytophthora fragariaefolia TaxID=1490495 RepID=A0A9W6X8V8_9STRA|nr:unnamed protein product [Phytophthora fragariaefolia]